MTEKFIGLADEDGKFMFFKIQVITAVIPHESGCRIYMGDRCFISTCSVETVIQLMGLE